MPNKTALRKRHLAAVVLLAFNFFPAAAQDRGTQVPGGHDTAAHNGSAHHGGQGGSGAAQDPASSAEAAFLNESNAAMKRMMAATSIRPTGDVDRDFVAMMIPHHQAAIDMAKAVLRAGKNETIRRLAQEIIVTQEDEIRVMRSAIGDAGPGPQHPLAGAPAPSRSGLEH